MRPWFDRVAARADSPARAIVTPEVTLSYRDIFRRGGGARQWLDAIDAPVGRPIVALLESSPDAFGLVLAAAASGRPLAPLSPRLTVDELSRAVGPLAPSIIVADERGEALATELGAKTGVPVEVLPALAQVAWDPVPDIDPGIPFIIMHTAGTTGVPKPVPKLERYMAGGGITSQLLTVGEGSLYATASPFNHVAGVGMFLMSVSVGAAIAALPRFSVEGWSEALDLGVTHATLVPTMIEMLITAGAFRPGDLRVLQHGAAPMPPDLLRRAMELLPGVDFLTIYGQTEGAPITALMPDDHRAAVAGRPELLETVGRAAPGVEMRLAEVGPDGVGEVTARAPDIFPGGPDGWLRTGDLGSVDDGGYLRLAGRKGDMIIRGGENVYPIEVENVLEAHPFVREVAVVGERDARYGEIVVAYVVAQPDAGTPDEEELRRYAREHLAGFKVPARWEYVDALPRSPAGKVLRRLLTPSEGP